MQSQRAMKPWMVVPGVLLLSSCTSDLFAHPVVSRAIVRIDLARPDAPPEVDVALTLVGGDQEHQVMLDAIFIGDGFASERELDLRFPTPTVHMEPKTMALVPLVAGQLLGSELIDDCQSTLPIRASMRFEDTADLIALSPVGQLAVFCD